MYTAHNSLVKTLILTATCAGALSACGGNDASSANQTVDAQSEHLQRRDKAAASVSTAAAAYQKEVQELFMLYYGRPADATSLATDENTLLNAGAPTTIPALFTAYSSNAAVKSLIDGFGSSSESQTLYGTGSASAYVTAVYQKVLGRAPTSTNLSTAITNYSTSAGYAALGIMASALSDTSRQGLLDSEIIGNRELAAALFTNQVAANANADYSGSAAITSARSMISSVVWTSPAPTVTAAVKAAIPYSISVTVSVPNNESTAGLVLQNNGGDNLTISAAGKFTFAGGVTSGNAYSVTVLTQPNLPSQTCTPSSSSGTLSNAAISNVQVTCVNSFPVEATGDSRWPSSAETSPPSVTEPAHPTVCATLHAQFSDNTAQPASAYYPRTAASPASDDTTSIQNALNNCAAGQAVELSASGSNNAFYSNMLTLNGVGLLIDSGVTLYGSNSYVINAELIYVTGTNASIMGLGTIDGRGDIISTSSTPRLVQASNITNFTAYQITLAHAIHPNLYVEGGNGFLAYGITINTSPNQANADGIDIDSLTNATVYGSNITDGDDGIALKTNSGNISNVTLYGNNLYGTHGLSVGSIDANTVSNILFDSNYVYGTVPSSVRASSITAPSASLTYAGTASTDQNAINVKTGPCGLSVTNVTYRNTCITGAKHLITFSTNYNSCTGSGSPSLTNIVVDGAYATSSVSGGYSELYGPNASNPIYAYLDNIILDSNGTGQSGNQYANVYYLGSNASPPVSSTSDLPAASSTLDVNVTPMTTSNIPFTATTTNSTTCGTF